MQTSFDFATERPSDVQAAIDTLSEAAPGERGAVFTRRNVVDFILNLVGYVSEEDLTPTRLLEPSFGSGEFLLAAIDRLLPSYLAHGGQPDRAAHDLRPALCGVELHRPSFAQTRRRLIRRLTDYGLSLPDAERLASAWLHQDDFLLTELKDRFTHIVGNPPYLRQERIPAPLIREYRKRFETIYDRADLYVPFIEKSLKLLDGGGALSFICSDRWMKNRYGAKLRKLVAEGFHLQSYVDMTGLNVFEGNPTAYPAIFMLTRKPGNGTGIVRQPRLDKGHLETLALAMRTGRAHGHDVHVIEGVVAGDQPWLFDTGEALELLRRLENRLPLIQEAGCKVGIGVATGADKIYIRPMDALPVEASRKLPIVLASDLRSGRLEWSGNGVLNPYEPDGSPARLASYPRFAAYLQTHEAAIRRRHTARQNPHHWYKTIDRIYPDLTSTPKLLIPDIKGAANVVYDEGAYYPHHNLYYVTSDAWDLRALQAVLRSAVAEFFVAMYCVKMRGGYLRFQAQYLRRIRLPLWERVPEETRKRLRRAAEAERAVCDQAAFDLYDLTPADREVMRSIVYKDER